MSNADRILEILDNDRSAAWCDDCLSTLSGVEPRQQVYSICSRLSEKGIIRRARGVCAKPHGGSNKLVNSFRAEVGASTHVRPKPKTTEVDIEKMRTGLVRICQDLLRENKLEVPDARGLGPLITKLKDEDVLPRHQVNMMLTINSLRIAHVFDRVEIGTKEAAIASAAWEILQEWLKETNRGVRKQLRATRILEC